MVPLSLSMPSVGVESEDGGECGVGWGWGETLLHKVYYLIIMQCNRRRRDEIEEDVSSSSLCCHVLRDGIPHAKIPMDSLTYFH